MKSFLSQAQAYADYHHNAKNRFLNLIAVPLFTLSWMIFFAFVKIIVPGVFEANLADLLAVVLLAYYFRLNWRLALVLLGVFIVLLWFAEYFSFEGPNVVGIWAFLVTLVVSLVLLFIGYSMEEKRPAPKELACLAITAPMFWAAEMLFMLGWMRDLHTQIHGDQSIHHAEKEHKHK